MNLSPRSALEWARTHQGRKFIRYTLTSAATTGISLGAVAGLYGFRVIPSVIWATLAGNVIGMIPAYNLNRRWAWGKRGPSRVRQEVAPFFMISSLGIAFSQLGAWWARDEVNAHQWSHALNTALVAGTNLACFGVFWVLKLMLFNRIFKVHPLEEFDEHLRAEERFGN